MKEMQGQAKERQMRGKEDRQRDRERLQVVRQKRKWNKGGCSGGNVLTGRPVKSKFCLCEADRQTKEKRKCIEK